jgi:hypothetical protein
LRREIIAFYLRVKVRQAGELAVDFVKQSVIEACGKLTSLPGANPLISAAPEILLT